MALVLCIVLSCPGFAQQPWAPDGAVWHYGFDRADPALHYGYVRIQPVGDTMLQGHSCRILDQFQVDYHVWYPAPGIDSGSIGQVYTYADSTKVYAWNNGKFYTLYDFGAAPGAVWTVPWYGMIPPDTGQVQLDAVGFTVINGDTLKTLYVSRVPGSCVGWYNAVVVEHIGVINEYMFPDYSFECIADIQFNGYFRCYQDPGFPLYSVTNSDTICEYLLTGVDERNASSPGPVIAPNPADRYVSVRLPSGTGEIGDICLFSLDGRRFSVEWSKCGSSSEVDVSFLPDGAYILEIVPAGGLPARCVVLVRH